MPGKIHLFHQLCRIPLIILLLTTLSGCGLVGGFYGVFIDPFIPKAPVPAEHDMSQKTILVWVDYEPLDEQHHLLRRELTQQLHQFLLQNNAVVAVIDYQQIVNYRLSHPESVEMSLQQLGRRFTADEVLYLLIDEFELLHDAGPGYYKPRIAGYSKVIDVASGKRLWPADQLQRRFTLDTGFTEAKDSSLEQRLVRRLCRELAQKIAPFFYEHRPSRQEK